MNRRMNSYHNSEPTAHAAWTRRAATVGAVLGLGLTAALGVFAAPLPNSPAAGDTPQEYSSPLFHAGGTTDPNTVPAGSPPPYTQLQGTPSRVFTPAGSTNSYATEIPSHLLGNYQPASPPAGYVTPGTPSSGFAYYPNHFHDGSNNSSQTFIEVNGPFSFTYPNPTTTLDLNGNTVVANAPADVQSTPAAVNVTEYPEVANCSYFGRTASSTTAVPVITVIQTAAGAADPASKYGAGNTDTTHLHDIRQVVYFCRTETVPVVTVGGHQEAGGVVLPNATTDTTEPVGAIYAMDGFTGDIIWRYQTVGFSANSAALSSPAVARINVLDTTGAVHQHVVVIAADNNGFVYCLDAVGQGDGASNSTIVRNGNYGVGVTTTTTAGGVTTTTAAVPPDLAYDTALATATNLDGTPAQVGHTTAFWVWRPDPNQPRTNATLPTTSAGTGGPSGGSAGTPPAADPTPSATHNLPVPGAFSAAGRGNDSPAVFVRPVADALGHNAGDGIVYIGNPNGTLYALDATGVSPANAAFNAPRTGLLGTVGAANATVEGVQDGTNSCSPLWWFTNTATSIVSAPAVYQDPNLPAVNGAAPPVVCFGTCGPVADTAPFVGRVYAVDGLYGPRGDGGHSDPTPAGQLDFTQPATYTGPGSVNYNVGQRAFWAFPDAYGNDYVHSLGSTASSAYQSWGNNHGVGNPQVAPALGDITGSPVVFNNPDDTSETTNGTTRIYFTANVGDEANAIGTPTGALGRVWAVNTNGSASVLPVTTAVTGTGGPGGAGGASTTDIGVPWSFPQANNPNDVSTTATAEPVSPIGGFLDMTPAIGAVQYQKIILNGDNTPFVHADGGGTVVSGTTTGGSTTTGLAARTVTFDGNEPGGTGPSIPMLYVGTFADDLNGPELFSIDIDGQNDNDRIIDSQNGVPVPSPSGAGFESAPVLVVNSSTSGGNGGSVFMTAGNTVAGNFLFQFEATPISGTDGNPWPFFFRTDQQFTGSGGLSGPAVAAANVVNLPGEGGSNGDVVRDWVYVGDDVSGLCRGFTPGANQNGNQAFGFGGGTQYGPTNASTVNTSLPLRAYIFDGSTTGTNPHPGTSLNMKQANPAGGTNPPALFDWGQDAYIRIANVVPPPPAGDTGTQANTAVVLDPTQTGVAYGDGGPVIFTLSDTTQVGQQNAGTNADTFTVPPRDFTAATAITTTPAYNGIYKRDVTDLGPGATGTTDETAVPNSLLQDAAKRGYVAAFTYQVAYGGNLSRLNTPGARRHITSATQVVHVYQADASGAYQPTGQTVTLGTINGNATTPTAPAAGSTQPGTATFTVTQPTFGILNPLAARGGGIPVSGGSAQSLGYYLRTGNISDGIGPFRAIVANPNGSTFDLQAVSNGNRVFTQNIPPSGFGNAPTTTGGGGAATTTFRQRQAANDSTYPTDNLRIITTTSEIPHGTSGDNTDPIPQPLPTGNNSTLNNTLNGLIGTGFGPAALDLADRSLLGTHPDPNNTQNPQYALQVSIQKTALTWNDNADPTTNPFAGGAAAVVNPLPWEQLPNVNGNPSVDYPDIRQSALQAELATSSLSVSAPSAANLPFALITGTATPTLARTVRPDSVRVQVNVLKYQPANLQLFQTNTATTQPRRIAPVAGPSGNGAFLNSNAGTLFPMGYVSSERISANAVDLTATATAAAPNVNDTNVAYRNVSVYTGVPVDMSTSIQNSVTDVGTVPHGFGIQMDGYVPPSLGTAIGAFTPYNLYAGYAGHFQPLTIRNNGNTNLVNPHLDQKLQFNQYSNGTLTAGALNTLPLLSDALNTGMNSPLSSIPAFDTNNVSGNSSPFLVRSSVDTDLVPLGVNPYFSAYDKATYPVGTARLTFHKARVGDSQGTTMTVPDVPHDASRYTLPKAQGQLAARAVSGQNVLVDPATGAPATTQPYVSVAVPLGTPVGNYSSDLQLFEGYDPSYNPLTGPAYTAVNNDILAVLQDVNPNTNQVVSQHGIQPTSKPGTQLLVHVNEDRATDGFTPGALPQFDIAPALNAAGTVTGAADFAPAALRDPATGDLDLYWTSSRAYNPATPTPPYSIFGTSLTFNNGGATYYQSAGAGHFQPTSLQSWWALPSAPLTSVTSTEFSLAENQNQNTGFPSGNHAYGFVTTITGSGTTTQYGINCAEITNPAQAGSLGTAVPVAASTQPKSGVHGLAIANVSFPDAAAAAGTTPANITNNLWAFWTGGTRGRTALYYGSSTANGTPGTFTTPATLPVPASLVSLADATATSVLAPDVTTASGANPAPTLTVPAIEVTYSGVSATGNSDIYVSRYRPYNFTPTGAPTGTAPTVLLGLMRMPQVTEQLQADPNSRWYQARDVGWARTGPNGAISPISVNLTVSSISGSTVTTSPSDTYTLDPTGTTVLEGLNGAAPTADATAKVVFDRASGLLVLTNVDVPTLNGATAATIPGQSIFIDLASGRVRFSVPLPTGTTTTTGGVTTNITTGVQAAFYPTARRVTTSPAADTAPVAFLDRAYEANASGVAADPNVQADRYWVLWHKDAVGKTNPTLWYKTQRLTFALTATTTDTNGNVLSQPVAIPLTTGGQPNVTVTFNGATVYAPGGGTANVVDVDPARGRICFPITLSGVPTEGQGVSVSVNGSAPYTGTIHWLDEPRYNDTANQNAPGVLETAAEDGALVPIQNIANEGGVTAFLDPVAYGNPTGVASSQIPHNVWVFWTSTRSGTSDIFYETINPRFGPTAP